MSSKLVDFVPLLRIPLLFTSTLGLILSSVSVGVSGSSYGGWDDDVRSAMCALIAFNTTSMTATAAFVYSDHRRGGVKLPQGCNFALAAMARGCVDAANGLTFLILHIVVSASAADTSNVILNIYAGFCALPASIFHGVLAVHSLVAAIRSRQLTQSYCPACHQRLRRCDSPDHGIVEAGEQHVYGRAKGDESPVANREGSLEGDRLIVPAGDEA